MDYVLYENYNPHIVIITLNRPERLNAMGRQLSAELSEALDRYNRDPQARVAVLTAAGRAFSAGLDLKERAEQGDALVEPVRSQFINEFGTPDRVKPVIAGVKGYCLGAGVDTIILHCDIRIAGESALFGMPEVNVGLVVITTPFANQNFHHSLMSEFFMTGDNFSAQRAYDLGLVSMVVPDDEVMPVALRMAERIASRSPGAVRMTKMNMLQTFGSTPAAIAWNKYLWDHPSTAHDVKEGALAFVEKRAPVWRS